MKFMREDIDTSKKVLLLCEKSSNIKELLKTIFDEHSIVVKSNENKAKQFFIMRSPDLVLIYLEDGQRSIDLLKEMVNLNPSIPVIVMAEKGSERLAVEAFRGGAWDYFSQPIDIKELSNRISSLLGIPLQQEKRNFNSLIKAIKFINENYTKHLKLSDIARISCMSVSTFERIFKKEIGVTFITYVNRLRISKAINLLKEDMSMNEIAVTCGFTSQSHFCRVFKNITGISPREYKRSM